MKIREGPQSFGIKPDEYRYGIMLETSEAVQNVDELAKHVDFISVGSNDLTSAILGILRSDAEARSAFHDKNTGTGDAKAAAA